MAHGRPHARAALGLHRSRQIYTALAHAAPNIACPQHTPAGLPPAVRRAPQESYGRRLLSAEAAGSHPTTLPQHERHEHANARHRCSRAGTAATAAHQADDIVALALRQQLAVEPHAWRPAQVHHLRLVLLLRTQAPQAVHDTARRATVSAHDRKGGGASRALRSPLAPPRVPPTLSSPNPTILPTGMSDISTTAALAIVAERLSANTSGSNSVAAMAAAGWACGSSYVCRWGL